MRVSWRWFSAAAVLTLAGDLATKALVEATVSPFTGIDVVDGLFRVVNVRNTGAAFSLLSGGGAAKTAFFIAVGVVALGVILHLARKAQASARLEPCALGLVFGGAAGNLHDRVRFGEVVDFLDVYWGSHHWPAFNVADAAIVAGIGLILLTEFTGKKKTEA